MAQKLVDYFVRVKKQGGIASVVKFAMITKISSAAAAELPDSPENLALFEECFRTLKREFPGG